jgi:hypothetical protein
MRIPAAIHNYEVNLSWLDPAGFDVDSYRGREAEGCLVVDNAGEMLYLPDEELPW